MSIWTIVLTLKVIKVDSQNCFGSGGGGGVTGVDDSSQRAFLDNFDIVLYYWLELRDPEFTKGIRIAS